MKISIFITIQKLKSNNFYLLESIIYTLECIIRNLVWCLRIEKLKVKKRRRSNGGNEAEVEEVGAWEEKERMAWNEASASFFFSFKIILTNIYFSPF